VTEYGSIKLHDEQRWLVSPILADIIERREQGQLISEEELWDLWMLCAHSRLEHVGLCLVGAVLARRWRPEPAATGVLGQPLGEVDEDGIEHLPAMGDTSDWSALGEQHVEYLGLTPQQAEAARLVRWARMGVWLSGAMTALKRGCGLVERSC
jgi:hypothetical protein